MKHCLEGPGNRVAHRPRYSGISFMVVKSAGVTYRNAGRTLEGAVMHLCLIQFNLGGPVTDVWSTGVGDIVVKAVAQICGGITD